MKTGEIISEFSDIKDAVKKYPEFKNLRDNIKKCLSKERVSAYKFYWIYKKDYRPRILDTGENILQIDIMTREIVNEFLFIDDAVKKYPEIKRLRCGIKRCLSGEFQTSYDYIWVYRKNYKSREDKEKEPEDNPNNICQIDVKKGFIVREFAEIEDVLRKYPEFRCLRSGVRECLAEKQLISANFGWIYKYRLKELGIKNFIEKRIKMVDNLLVDLFPELVKEWNHEKNTHLDINNVKFGSGKKAYWNCLKKTEHPIFFSTISDRTRSDKPTGCPECSFDLRRIHNTKEKQEAIDKHNNFIKKDPTTTGDLTENYLHELLKKDRRILNIERTGYCGDKSDLAVTLEYGIKSLQIKTLSDGKANVYHIFNGGKYEDDMLIAMISKERDRFVLEFAGNIKTGKLDLSFDFKKISENMFTSEQIFLDKLIELLPLSLDYKLDLTDDMFKEYESMKRLEIFCINKRLTFKRNETNGNTIDAFIQDIPVQCKYHSSTKGDSI